MGMRKPSMGLDITYNLHHVIPHMRNANFTYKYGDYGTSQCLWNG